MDIHKHVYDKLDYFYRKNDIPNIIFHGSSGCGKKTILQDFLKKIYDNDNKKIKTNVMFVNCSHGKGIKFIRDELKMFAKMNLQYNSNVKFKSIVLLNADSLTNDAQSALRRCIEQFSYNTRFFIVVENKAKLLNPIISRFCDIFIPDYMFCNHKINLHHHFSTSIDVSKQSDTREKWFQMAFKNIETDDVFLVNLCESIYSQGYSCMEMIKFLETSAVVSQRRINDFVFEFNRVKSELKNEHLLIFYMLKYIWG